MKLSRAASGLETSLTRQLFNKAKQYNDVIDLTLGDPDLMPLQSIRNSACNAIQEGKTRYSMNAGLAMAREAYCKSFEKEYGVHIDSNSEVMLTIGGMGALYISMSALIDSGDEVLIIGPYYVNYVQMVNMCGGTPVIVYTESENNFKINPDELEKAVTDKTVAIIINSPCNPTGYVIDSAMIDKIADFAKKHDLVVITDEVYRSLLYDNKKHDSIITRSGMKDRTILIDSSPKYILIDLDDGEYLDLTEDERIDVVARRIMKQHKAAFLELAK